MSVITRTECPEHGHDVSWWAVSGPLGCNQCQRSGPRLVSITYVPADQIQGAVEALREIADADPVDMALDPGWAARVASEALTP